jgi:SAM-dependent methyltransferase
LRPDESVLDIGCGCGQMALQLVHFLDAQTGSYRGFDLHQPSIHWCQRHIANHHSNFVFTYADIFSRAYNQRGQIPAAEYRFPFPSESFALVIAKSVFTHMLPAAVENYLNEIARALAPSGRALLTFFLLNEQQRSREAAGLNQLEFSFGDSQCRFVHASSPESAVAYDESFVLSLLQSHGLRLKAPICSGTWSGNAAGLSFQDLLLVERVSQEK